MDYVQIFLLLNYCSIISLCFFILIYPTNALEINTSASVMNSSDSKTANSGFINSSVSGELLDTIELPRQDYPTLTYRSWGDVQASANENGQLTTSFEVWISNPISGGSYSSYTSLSGSIMNLSGNTQKYFFDFSIPELTLTKATDNRHFVQGGDTLGISILLNNSPIWDWFLFFNFVGGAGWDPTYTTFTEGGEDLNGVINNYTDVGDGGFYYAIPSFNKTLDLGIYQNGESFSLVYSIVAGGYGWVGIAPGAASGLPFGGLDYSEGSVVFMGEVRIEPIPEPTTMLLLGSGLIGLAAYGRKKFFKK